LSESIHSKSGFGKPLSKIFSDVAYIRAQRGQTCCISVQSEVVNWAKIDLWRWDRQNVT